VMMNMAWWWRASGNWWSETSSLCTSTFLGSGRPRDCLPTTSWLELF
jgi:hypothetical protein